MKTVLKIRPLFFVDNVKALYRRGKAHIGAWNPDKAKDDLNRVMQLDTSLTAAITKELQILNEKITSKNKQDKDKLSKLFV